MRKGSRCDKNELKKGAWTEDEDKKLTAYIQRYGHWNWSLLPQFAGMSRNGKSYRLRWMNYLRPNMKHGNFTEEEDNVIIDLHNKIGNKWSKIAAQLPGRSDNEIKNRWNTHLKKRVKDRPISFNSLPNIHLTNYKVQTADSNALLHARPGICVAKAAEMEVVVVPSLPNQPHLYTAAD